MTTNPHVHDNLKAIEKALSNYDMTFLSDDEEDFCPLCLETLDITDKNFKPCPCEYQICQFCYNNIRQNEELNGRCPACRRKYDDESVEYVILSTEELKMEREKQTRKEWERKQRDKERKENEYANRKHLAGMRVIQKNLVYVVGINPPVAYEEVSTLLKSDKYFGQYGKINKIVVNRKTPHSNSSSNEHYSHHHSTGYGVYITFAKKDDAARCIAQVDGTYMDGRLVKAAYGTTKYCSSYLRGLPCPNPNCMFLHEPGEEADSFNRRELNNKQQAQQQLNSSTSNTNNSMYFKNLPPTSTNASLPSAPSSNPPLLGSSSPSPAPIKTQLHQEQASATTPILTPASTRTTSNPWGITQASTPIASLNLSKNTSSANLPTLNDTLGSNQNDNSSQSINSSAGNRKKNSTEKEYVDPYDALDSAIRFLDQKLQFLSEYRPHEVKLKSNIISDDVYNRYPSLFSWENIEVSKESDNTLAKKLIDVLTIKPIDNSSSVLNFLQNVNIPMVQPMTGTTPIQQHQQLHHPQQQQGQPQMNTSLPPGMFAPQQQMSMQQGQQPQSIEGNQTSNSTDFLNQLINGRRVTAAGN